jgi:hypothetical protein
VYALGIGPLVHLFLPLLQIRQPPAAPGPPLTGPIAMPEAPGRPAGTAASS